MKDICQKFAFFFQILLYRKMRAKRSGKNEFMPFDDSDTASDFDEKHFQLSIHLSGGIFRSECTISS